MEADAPWVAAETSLNGGLDNQQRTIHNRASKELGENCQKRLESPSLQSSGLSLQQATHSVTTLTHAFSLPSQAGLSP